MHLFFFYQDMISADPDQTALADLDLYWSHKRKNAYIWSKGLTYCTMSGKLNSTMSTQNDKFIIDVFYSKITFDDYFSKCVL